MAREDDRYFHDDGLTFLYLEEVEVQDRVGDGVELKVLEDGLDRLAAYGEVDNEDVGRVDEVADSLLANREVNHVVASVEDCRDLVTCAQALGGLLAELGAELTAECECLHSVLNNVLLKISVF